MERWTESRIVFEGKIVTVRTGTVVLDDGTTAYREVVEHPGGVCILPFTGSSVILVRQFRIALNRDLLEAPAGKLEGPEDPLRRGLIELEEEVGLKAGRVVDAGKVCATVGFCSEVIHLFLAFDLEHTERRPEPDERIEVVEIPLDEVRAGLRDHRFDDAKTVVLLHRLLDHLDRRP